MYSRFETISSAYWRNPYWIDLYQIDYFIFFDIIYIDWCIIYIDFYISKYNEYESIQCTEM